MKNNLISIAIVRGAKKLEQDQSKNERKVFRNLYRQKTNK